MKRPASPRDHARTCSPPLEVPRLLRTLLHSRGITDVEAFLRPRLASLPSPLLMRDMDRAVDLILERAGQGAPLVIYGDYDVDGSTGIALLHDFLSRLGRPPLTYQPHRQREGYGLNSEAIRALASAHPGALLITVDCGISNQDEVFTATALGLDVIVTDHHLPPPVLPPAAAVLDPQRGDCGFPDKDLAGVGVALYLAMGLRSRLVEQGHWSRQSAPRLRDVLDLVALGTVADMAPLTGVNRVLVREGLAVLNTRPRPGIEALIRQTRCRDQGRPVDETAIGYQLGPRINAPGRLEHAGLALDLLLCTEERQARCLARRLDELNLRRRALGDQAFALACEICQAQWQEGRRGLVAQGDFHHGVVGIVASRLCEHFHTPALVFGPEEQDGLLRGSGRSVDGLHLHQALQDMASLLERFGGHAMAAGMTIRKDNFYSLCNEFDRIVKQRLEPRETEDHLPEHVEVDPCDLLDPALFPAYMLMAPFGQGNPEPLFRLSRVELHNTSVVGKGHLRFSIKAPGPGGGAGRELPGIGFGMADTDTSAPVDLFAHLRPSYFQGEARPQLVARIIRPADPPGPARDLTFGQQEGAL